MDLKALDAITKDHGTNAVYKLVPIYDKKHGSTYTLARISVKRDFNTKALVLTAVEVDLGKGDFKSKEIKQLARHKFDSYEERMKAEKELEESSDKQVLKLLEGAKIPFVAFDGNSGTNTKFCPIELSIENGKITSDHRNARSIVGGRSDSICVGGGGYNKRDWAELAMREHIYKRELKAENSTMKEYIEQTKFYADNQKADNPAIGHLNKPEHGYTNVSFSDEFDASAPSENVQVNASKQLEIRKDYEAKKLTIKQLADKHKIDPSTVSRLANEGNWKKRRKP